MDERGSNGVPTRHDVPKKPGSWFPIIAAVAGIVALAAVAAITTNEFEKQVDRGEIAQKSN